MKWLGSVDMPAGMQSKSEKQIPHPAKGVGIRDDSGVETNKMSAEPDGF
jgi:hypothetical protein